MQTTVKATKKGDYVTLTEGGPVWVRGDYCRASRAYILHRWDDINHTVTRKGSTRVFVGFTF